MSNAAIELIDLKKTLGKKEIIKGLSFSIDRGEVFGFIGPNGAGKTTTIRMMVGLMQITDGDVHILGNSIKTDYKEAISEVGAIVENPEMYPFMSGWQNLMHFSRMIPGVTKERIHEVIRLVGLEKAINEKVKKYSLGMRQRLGIAQALLHKPSVLILDEPTNGLDPAGIREIRKYIRALASEENVAVIISSHLLSEIELMCDRIGLIKNGELVATQDVNAATDQDSASPVQMEVTPIEHAIKILKSNHDIDATSENGTITIQSERDTIPSIIKTLINNDVLVYQVSITKSTLEDKFFDLIGENTIE
ncbi:ABC transporter ATP-binding protein [Virgibacillus salinus]|uniref:ABC-2 type transport system ATP-binding protein n=1 Tax=Virgibacillus salinus TaxID=553311 RepID=A0A1H1FX96_9BACI|nr:ABC transporter ATP-binding protein [Virgibacillus salinus]SDR05551.1 ABC-2 type transport system ATP-binding protein [Virgibacillus salinus]